MPNNLAKLASELRQFIIESLDSIEELELLLELHADPARSQSAAELSQKLRTDPDSTLSKLNLLTKKNLLTKVDDRYRFAPTNPEAPQRVAELAAAYRNMRFSVINLIFSKPTGALKVFANAFRIKKDPSDG